jgi:hypothetical protein
MNRSANDTNTARLFFGLGTEKISFLAVLRLSPLVSIHTGRGSLLANRIWFYSYKHWTAVVVVVRVVRRQAPRRVSSGAKVVECGSAGFLVLQKSVPP